MMLFRIRLWLREGKIMRLRLSSIGVCSAKRKHLYTYMRYRFRLRNTEKNYFTFALSNRGKSEFQIVYLQKIYEIFLGVVPPLRQC
jgi:hypothetical protein